MARKFLYIVAGITILVIAVVLGMRIWAERLTELAFVPTVEFAQRPALQESTYSDPAMWFSRPGLGEKDPALWTPPNLAEDGDALGAAVFFVHPTSFFEKSAWNAPAEDKDSRDLASLFVQGMASPFNKNVDVWAPRYRQATIGAFLTSDPAGRKALDLAYSDILQAFDTFIGAAAPNKPIVLAGHSQGAFHLRRLMQDRINGTPLLNRVAVAYLIGWPLSLDHDLPQMGLPPCAQPDQSGCIVSWLVVAEPAETNMILKTYARQSGLDGETLEGADFLCSNPLTGATGGEAPVSANLGSLVPDITARSGSLIAGKVPARCRPDGFLSIGPPPDLGLGPYVMPGNNYHLFDITLFWANLRRDVSNRVRAWDKEP